MVTPTIQGYRLSIQQKRLWLLHQSSSTRLRALFLIEGPLSGRRLADALTRLRARHETLRTRFDHLGSKGLPLQVISEAHEVCLPLIDLSDLGDEGRRRLLEVAPGGLDEGQDGGEFAVRLMRLEGRRHVLGVSVSALCLDEWSLGSLLKELARLYAAGGGEGDLDDAVQYADFSEWQHELALTEEEEEGRAFWRAQDLGAVVPVRLPFENGVGPKDFEPQGVESEPDPALRSSLASLAEAQG